MGAGDWLTFHKLTEKVPDLLRRSLTLNDRTSGISMILHHYIIYRTSPQMPLPTNFLTITLSCLNQADMALLNKTLCRLSTLLPLLPLETRCLFRFIPPPTHLSSSPSPLLFGHKASPLSKFRTKFDDGKIGHFKFREQPRTEWG